MIGVFDSGVGGLGVLHEMLALFDDETVVYVADRANSPYGTRSMSEVQRLSHQIAAQLIRDGASTIVVACNTASAGALASLRAAFPETSFVGMEPAVKPAAEATHAGVIGVLATEVTFQGELFSSLVDQYASDLRILTRAAPEWVKLVEQGQVAGPQVESAVRRHIEPLLEQQADTLVLGCTHFPFLTAVINSVAGPDVAIIDPAPAVARQADRVHSRRSGRPGLQARVTGDIAEFISLSRSLSAIHFRDGVLPLVWDEYVSP